MLAMLIYIWFRFEWQFALGAIISTLHDVIMMVGFFVWFQLEFNLTSIAAILTVVGYSINDTVVVYDRVRENLSKFKKMPIEQLLDLSMNETLSRTILTGITTLMALTALYLRGGEVIASFTIAMIFGILIGTYSSYPRCRPAADPLQPATSLRNQGRRGNCSSDGAALEAVTAAMAEGTVIRKAHFPGRAPVDAYGNGGFRFAEMSHRGSILCLPSGIHGWEPADPAVLKPEDFGRVLQEAEGGRDPARRHRQGAQATAAWIAPGITGRRDFGRSDVDRRRSANLQRASSRGPGRGGGPCRR